MDIIIIQLVAPSCQKKALAQDRCTSNFLNQMIKILLPRLAVLVRTNQLSFKQAEWRRCLDCFSGVSV